MRPERSAPRWRGRDRHRSHSPFDSSARRAEPRAPSPSSGSPGRAEAARCGGASPPCRSAAPRRPRGSTANGEARWQAGSSGPLSVPEHGPLCPMSLFALLYAGRQWAMRCLLESVVITMRRSPVGVQYWSGHDHAGLGFPLGRPGTSERFRQSPEAPFITSVIATTDRSVAIEPSRAWLNVATS